jgi:hypothetical protein
MAVRPVFVPQPPGRFLVSEVPVEFKWNPGMAPTQKKKNVVALHEAARSRGLDRLLEISSKSEEEVGRRLSAFSLKLMIHDKPVFLECAYQGSKVFEGGGPYSDLFHSEPRDAKKDPRLRDSGKLVRFEFVGESYPLSPKNAFYDWLYIKALVLHRAWIKENLNYQGFTDIEFNPERSVNCQARAFAELVAMENNGQLERASEDFEYFASLLPAI